MFCLPIPVIVSAFALSLSLRLPIATDATFHHTLAGGCWATNATAAEGAGGSWQTKFDTYEYFFAYRPRGIGFRAQYGAGNQSNFGGTFGAALSGRDDYLNLDLTGDFNWIGLDWRVFLGWGYYRWETVFPAPTGTRWATSKGVRLGVETSIPISSGGSTGLIESISFNIKGTLQPWNQLSAVPPSGGAAVDSPTSSHQLILALRFKLAPPAGYPRIGRVRLESPRPSGSYILAGFTTQREGFDPWAAIDVFYESKSSPYAWSGFGVKLSKTF